MIPNIQEPNSHISILDYRQNCACWPYLYNPYMGAATLRPPPPPARLLYTVYIKKLSNDVKWVYIYILYIMGTEIRRLTPYIMSIMKSLVIPAIGLALSSVIYSRVTLVLFFALGDWLWKPANNTVENNGAVGYFGSSLTVYNSLFFYSQIVTK